MVRIVTVYAVCAVLGVAVGLRLRWPGLVIAALFVALASGSLAIAAGLSWRSVLAQAGLSLVALEAGYAATLAATAIFARYPGWTAWLGANRRDKLEGDRASHPRRG